MTAAPPFIFMSKAKVTGALENRKQFMKEAYKPECLRHWEWWPSKTTEGPTSHMLRPARGLTTWFCLAGSKHKIDQSPWWIGGSWCLFVLACWLTSCSGIAFYWEVVLCKGLSGAKGRWHCESPIWHSRSHFSATCFFAVGELHWGGWSDCGHDASTSLAIYRMPL